MMEFLRNLGKTEHERVNGWLSTYLDDELTSSQRKRVERHLNTCAACQRELETLRQTAHLLQRTPAIKVPRSFILNSVQVTTQPARWQMGYIYLRGATAFVTVLFLLVVAGDLLWQPRSYTSSTMPEIIMEKEAADESITITEVPLVSTPEPKAEVKEEKEVVQEVVIEPTAAPEKIPEASRGEVNLAMPAEAPAAAPEPRTDIAEMEITEEAPMMLTAPEAPGGVQERERSVDSALTEDAAAFGTVPESAAEPTSTIRGGKGAVTQMGIEEDIVSLSTPTSLPIPSPARISYGDKEDEGMTDATAPIPTYPLPTRVPAETVSRSPFIFGLTWVRAAEIGLGLTILILGMATVIIRSKVRRE